MQTTLSTALYWLVLTVGLTAIMWLPYIINRMSGQGIMQALWDPFGETVAKAAWANRVMRAHENALDNLLIFASLVLLVHMTGQGSALTENACVIYFAARLVHYAGFTFAVPIDRVAGFLLGFCAQAVLALSVVHIM